MSSDDSEDEVIPQGGIVWYFEDDSTWKSYEATDCEKIEKAYKSRKLTFKLTRNKYSYELDFKSMTQKNLVSNKLRKIYRGEMLWEWKDQDNKFKGYTPEISIKLEEAFIKRDPNPVLYEGPNGLKYKIYPLAKPPYQENTQSRTKRPVQRRNALLQPANIGEYSSEEEKEEKFSPKKPSFMTLEAPHATSIQSTTSVSNSIGLNNSNSNSPFLSNKPAVIWQFRGDKGWESYETGVSRSIEQQFQMKREKMALSFEKEKYELDFKRMVQINLTSKKERTIQRLDSNISKSQSPFLPKSNFGNSNSPKDLLKHFNSQQSKMMSSSSDEEDDPPLPVFETLETGSNPTFIYLSDPKKN